jgi:general secretion pathway protein D
LLAGLISELDRKTASKVPGLGQLPVLGRLFSNNNSNNVKTEIILSITPRIVRSVATADASLRDIYSGTESSMRQAPLRLDPVGAAGGAPSVVSGVAPGGSRPEAPSIERTPRPPEPRRADTAKQSTGAARPRAAPPTPVGKQLQRRVS